MFRPKCQVLFIDDHKDTSEMLMLLLSQEDYGVMNASTVAEALRLASTEKFDLYVLDKRLPDGNGIELCAKLNQITPGIPCLFYTGDAYELHKAEALAAGAHGYVAKPDIDGLIENITRLLSERDCASAAA